MSRKTSINVSETLDKEVEEILVRLKSPSMNFTRVLETAVSKWLETMKSTGTFAPTYAQDRVYALCEDGEDGLEVECADRDGREKLRPVKSLNEALDRKIYVAVRDHDVKWPRGQYDFKEVPPPPDSEVWEFVRLFDEEWQPTYFQEAALVATPKLGLI